MTSRPVHTTAGCCRAWPKGAVALTAHLPEPGSYRPAAGPAAVLPGGAWTPNTNNWLRVNTLAAAAVPTGPGTGAIRCHLRCAGSKAAPSLRAIPPAMPPISSSSAPVHATTGACRLPSGEAASTDQRPRARAAAVAAGAPHAPRAGTLASWVPVGGMPDPSCPPGLTVPQPTADTDRQMRTTPPTTATLAGPPL